MRAMPRGPRLDAPGTLHHIMVRGIEGRPITREDSDRADFVRRLAVVATERDLTVYCAVQTIDHSSSEPHSPRGESEEGRRPAPLGRARGEGREPAVCLARARAFPANEAARASR